MGGSTRYAIGRHCLSLARNQRTCKRPLLSAPSPLHLCGTTTRGQSLGRRMKDTLYGTQPMKASHRPVGTPCLSCRCIMQENSRLLPQRGSRSTDLCFIASKMFLGPGPGTSTLGLGKCSTSFQTGFRHLLPSSVVRLYFFGWFSH